MFTEATFMRVFQSSVVVPILNLKKYVRLTVMCAHFRMRTLKLTLKPMAIFFVSRSSRCIAQHGHKRHLIWIISDVLIDKGL